MRHAQGDKRIEGFDCMPLATEPAPYRLNSQATPNGKFEGAHRRNDQPRCCDGQAQREPKAGRQEGTHGADCNFLDVRKAKQARPQATLVWISTPICRMSDTSLSGSTQCPIIQRPGFRIEPSIYCFRAAMTGMTVKS